jgi:hypothetical protein
MKLLHGTQRIMTVRRKTSVLMAVIGLVLSFAPSNGWRYLVSNDRTMAMALKLAGEKLRTSGWNYNHEKIGLMAAEIIKGLNSGLEQDTQ